MLLTIDWSFWATVIGTVATVVFGLWAILLAKRREYPGQLTYFHEPAIRLLNDITGSLSEIAVTYKGQPVRKNLTLLRGFLVNTGTKDITKEMVEKPLCIELPEGCRWLEASGKCPSNCDERAKISDPNTVVMSLGLFRCDEYLRFEARVEVSEGGKWAGTLSLNHRIADTSRVRWKKVPDKPKDLRKNVTVLACACLGGLLFLALAAGGVWTGRDSVFALVDGTLLLGFGALAMSRVMSSYRNERRIRMILKLDSD